MNAIYELLLGSRRRAVLTNFALWALIIAAGVALCSCASAPAGVPKTVVQTVNVPVSKSCVPSGLGAPPQYVDTDAALRAAPGAEDRFQLLAAGRVQRIGRAREVEPVIQACR